MYSFIDRPAIWLNNGSRFALWAMRAWVHALGAGHCPPAALAPAFARMGALPVLPDLHMAMALLNRDALDQLAFSPLDCPRIGEDEAVLLGIWRDLAAGATDRARDTLRLMVDEDVVDLVNNALNEATTKLCNLMLAPSGLESPVEGAVS